MPQFACFLCVKQNFGASLFWNIPVYNIYIYIYLSLSLFLSIYYVSHFHGSHWTVWGSGSTMSHSRGAEDWWRPHGFGALQNALLTYSWSLGWCALTHWYNLYHSSWIFMFFHGDALTPPPKKNWVILRFICGMCWNTLRLLSASTSRMVGMLGHSRWIDFQMYGTYVNRNF